MICCDTPSWDQYFMTMAYLCATRSKDPDTHVGAVIVGPDNVVRSTGYNGFPRGLNDLNPARLERPEKYAWIEHAERNAIYNAARIGIPLLDDCCIYVCGIPCNDCARAIIQSGIVRVVVDKFWCDQDSRPEWKDKIERTRVMFEEAGVELVENYFKLIPITKKLRNKDI